MVFKISADKVVIFSYFSGIILLGALLLMLPSSWAGPKPLGFIDALFTSTSAVCVTGLTVVDTALFTLWGQLIIAALIQFGGLGIITFATIYVAIPHKKIALMNRSIIKDYYLDEVEYNPKTIIGTILATTVAVEGLGAVALYFRFRNLKDGLFIAIFHSVSAFCNAGFSTFSTNLEGYVGDPIVNIAIMLLIVMGGLGFIVVRDIMKRMSGKRKRLSTHSRIALSVTFFLIIAGAILFFILESHHSMRGLPLGTQILASFFQSVTPRTAGFDTIIQSRLSDASVLITIVLMFIGACPGSTGGGIKTTTFFVLAMTALKGPDDEGNIRIGKRSITSASVLKAVGILGKGVMIVIVSATVILFLERPAIISGAMGLIDVLFEVVSAFGTVGLSLGITASLVPAAKVVLILTMFAGRVGLFAMSLPGSKARIAKYARLPEANVMLG
jgi:trk system potassium uptake protein